jgi:hypothetical protein
MYLEKHYIWYDNNIEIVNEIIDKIMNSFQYNEWNNTINYDIKYNISSLKEHLIIYLYKSQIKAA